ncbi:HEAT repeat domain-containing protein [bacterium]|nr:HEAT repeat domain-containing protein [bacterium]
MRRTTYAVLCILTLAAAVGAAESETLKTLDTALASAVTFEYSGDAGPLNQISDIVIKAATDPKMRDAVEARLIRALASNATVDAKSFLCRKLRTIGTAKSVPALAALLTDPKLSHMARYALGSMEEPAAVDALYAALPKTSGDLQAGMVNTLGSRRYAKAAPAIAKLLGSNNSVVAVAAAGALGHIGGPLAAKALEAALPKAAGPLRTNIENSLLACARQLVDAGQTAEATRIYDIFYAQDQSKHVRLAALHGLVAAQGADAAPLLVTVIKTGDAMFRASAIGLAQGVKGTEATKTFAALLPSLPPDTQALLVGSLAGRGDTAAAPAVLAATKSEHEAVRTAALLALGSVGDASSIPLLAQAATSPQQAAARSSLSRLPGKDIDAALVAALTTGDPQVRVEIIHALASRGAAQAVAPLLKIAQGDDAALRREAIRALGTLAPQAQLPALVALVVNAKDAKDRSAAEQAVANAFRRAPAPADRAAPVLTALPKASPEARAALLKLLSRAPTADALTAIRAGLKDAAEPVQDAAIRTLADWPNPAPAEDLLKLARTAPKPAHKVLALRGYVRLAALSKNPTQMYVRAMDLATRAEDKKLLLGGLGTADSAEALDIVEKYLANEPLQAEAALAAIQIANRIRERDGTRARKAIDAVLATVKDPRLRQQAQDFINDLEKNDGYILVWMGAGPYTVKGKSGLDLFDLAFPPEKPDAKDVKWTRLTKGINACDINLEAAISDGDHCAAYVRTRVWAPADLPVRLELGSDDAIRVWLNGKHVHGKNGSRGMTLRQDRPKADLKKGWNDLLLKVIDHEGGWAFACRIRKPDGSALEGLKYEAK